MTRSDLPSANRLRALAGWNQTLADWQRFLAAEPQGCFVAESAGAIVGTAVTTTYGADLAWIGMVLVDPSHRRRGIGGALLKHCIASLQERGVRCIKLDATPAGKLVYDNLGFQSEWTLSRWTTIDASVSAPTECPEPPSAGALPGHGKIRDWHQRDLPRVQSLDQAAFGVSRHRILQSLATQSRRCLVWDTHEIGGFGFLRGGADASYLGPVVARGSTEALALVEALTASLGRRKIYWDIPDQNAPAVAWAAQHGFTVQRTLTRMYLGENLVPGDPARQFALAGPEIG